MKSMAKVVLVGAAVALLGAAPAGNSSLPALLIPQVHSGQQLQYRVIRSSDQLSLGFGHNSRRPGDTSYSEVISSATPSAISWMRQYTNFRDYSDRFAIDSGGTVTFSTTGQPAHIEAFAYNTALFGKPPAALTIGAHWDNTVFRQVSGLAWTDYWSVTVADMQPGNGLVRLHLAFVRRSNDRGFYSDQLTDGQQDGDVVFVHGIMTKLSMRGYSTTYDDSGYRLPTPFQSDPSLPYQPGAFGLLSSFTGLHSVTVSQEVSLQGNLP